MMMPPPELRGALLIMEAHHICLHRQAWQSPSQRDICVIWGSGWYLVGGPVTSLAQAGEYIRYSHRRCLMAGWLLLPCTPNWSQREGQVFSERAVGLFETLGEI